MPLEYVILSAAKNLEALEVLCRFGMTSRDTCQALLNCDAE